jgi:hypothetical protein
VNNRYILFRLYFESFKGVFSLYKVNRDARLLISLALILLGLCFAFNRGTASNDELTEDDFWFPSEYGDYLEDRALNGPILPIAFLVSGGLLMLGYIVDNDDKELENTQPINVSLINERLNKK